MSRQRLVIGIALLASIAVLIALQLRHRESAPEPADKPASVTETSAPAQARPRRPRSSRPRTAPPETRAVSAVVAAEPAPPAPRATPASAQRSSSRVEQLAVTVLAAAVRGDWVVMDDHDSPCPPQQIRIVYEAPNDLGSYTKGAYFEPLGPGPSNTSNEVNGLLLCEGSSFVYRGFEAYFRDDRGHWDVFPFPIIE
ncbi:MAG: hypothetical protein IPI67_33535 [Myxococcales bacterium]|nr:hypothetical protein [Myxococcales bacterium]